MESLVLTCSNLEGVALTSLQDSLGVFVGTE